jgi:transposase
MYASAGRPSIPPEKLLRAQLLQMLYSIRSERLLMEEIDYSLLFRWFVGLNLDEEVWDATSFTKNRDRLLEAEVAKEFLAQVGGASARQRPDFGRALHRRWDFAGSLGGCEELSA